MLSKLKNITFLPLLFGLSAQPLWAGEGFHNLNVQVNWELWSKNSPGQGGDKFFVKDSISTFASDDISPDLSDFHSSTGNEYELWDIDFEGNKITLTYTSITKQLLHYEYMYGSSVGIHISDIANNLPAIKNVTVDSSFSPFGFNPRLVSYDENNIWVDLNGSMCHYVSMGSMPSCTNPESHTGYDNQIILMVEFDGEDGGSGGNGVDAINELIKADQLFDWAENNVKDIFSSQQESFTAFGYYIRYYPETDTYVGVQNGMVYLYGPMFNGLTEVGGLDDLLSQLGL